MAARPDHGKKMKKIQEEDGSFRSAEEDTFQTGVHNGRLMATYPGLSESGTEGENANG